MSVWSKVLGNGPELDAHELVTRAVKLSGSSDFGSEAWSEPLEVLTRSMIAEAALTRDGRKAAREFIVKLLAGRAEMPAELPEDASASLDPMVVVLGIDGSGAHHLARAIRAARSLLDDGDPPVPRRLETRLFLQEFTSFEFERRWHVPAFSEWLAEADLDASYASAAARVLAARNAHAHRGPVVLQGEHHLEHLDLLERHLPGALIVHVHREPMDCLAEAHDRLITARQSASDTVDPAKVSAYWTWRSGLLLDRYVDGRERWATNPTAPRIIDLDHEAIATDYTAAAAAVLAFGHTDTNGHQAVERFRLGATPSSTTLDPADASKFERYRTWVAASAA